jgi:hypothetical protein
MCIVYCVLIEQSIISMLDAALERTVRIYTDS